MNRMKRENGIFYHEVPDEVREALGYILQYRDKWEIVVQDWLDNLPTAPEEEASEDAHPADLAYFGEL
jgi:hypothetical protein